MLRFIQDKLMTCGRHTDFVKKKHVLIMLVTSVMGSLLSACGADDLMDYRLVVEEDATFCRPGVTGAGFQVTQAEKIRAWILPGEYQLPVTDAEDATELAWRLPVSLEVASETIADAAPEDGTILVEMNESVTGSRHRSLFSASQPVVGLDGRKGTFALEQVEEVADGRTFVVGARSDPVTLGVALWWDDPPDALMAACDVDFYFEGRLRRTWKVEHELGTIELDYAAGYWHWDVGRPIVFSRAAGDHMGVRVDQRDYFKLIHYPEDFDALRNNFAVLFDEPMDGACGIAFTSLAPGPDHPEFPRSASLVDCDFAEIRPVEILEATQLLRE